MKLKYKKEFFVFIQVYSKQTLLTSLEASLRKIKSLKHSANEEVSQKPIQKFWDVSQLFWMGDFDFFKKMEIWGMGLGMFWWSNRLRIGNLSLIYGMIKIREKKLGSLSTRILPAATTFSQISSSQ